MYFDKFGDSSAYERLIYHNHLKFMEPYVGGWRKVLDAGCGSGKFSVPIAESGSRVTCADISDLSMIPDNQFDTAICYGTFYNCLLSDLKKAVGELRRVTKDRGILIISVNSLWGMFRMRAVNGVIDPETGDLTDRHFYTSRELRDLLAEIGFDQIQTAASPSIMSGLRDQAEMLEINPAAWKTVTDLEDMAFRSEDMADAGEFILVKGRVIKSVKSAGRSEDISIETPRLLLREIQREDWIDIHKYSMDDEVVRFMPWGPNSIDDTKGFVERVLKERLKTPRREYHAAIIEKASGNLIGTAELALKGHDDMNGMLGYCFTKSSWGSGYGSETVGALIRFGFDELKIHRIWADCDTENYGSQKALEKNGMRREGCFMKKSFIKGDWRDDYHYAILSDDRVDIGPC